ncbi:MAG: phospholipid carrier-dependent glycosyltransferase [Chloroflexi bacterium]|nr:MAG: hypothetical protein CUN54_00735 [Phototrophicales bacterium]RMF82701.1 MAG: phospholipid carrier-dependent glycosyltransferase [Chloroflexota bacterium]
MLSHIARDKKTTFLLIIILLVAGVAQSQNMFSFPYYGDAEGGHLANAWALDTLGDLSPYTYAYENPPLGSVFLSIWSNLSGGNTSFGFSLNSGRVFMLGLHIITVALIFSIAHRVSENRFAGMLAALVFAFSPLVTTLQRRILLDNIMIVWLLLAMWFIVGSNRKLNHYFASAIAFSLAVLTKGGAIFFLPIIFLTIRNQAHTFHRRFATNLWFVMSGLVILLFPLYAFMREELFPEGWFLGGDFPHVSLLERIADRGPESGWLLNIGVGVRNSFDLWTDVQNLMADPIIIYGGLISLLFIAVLAIDNKKLRPLFAMNIGNIAYLIFAGQINNTDVVSMLAFFAINIGVLIYLATDMVTSFLSFLEAPVIRYGLAALTPLVLLYPFYAFYSGRTEIYTINQVEGQLQAIDWVNNNIPDDSIVVTDNFAFIELREDLPNIHDYWKVDTDPDIKFTLLADDPCNIDFMISTPQVISDIEAFNLDLMRRTFEDSELLLTFPNNGWPVEIRQINHTNCESSGIARQFEESGRS